MSELHLAWSLAALLAAMLAIFAARAWRRRWRRSFDARTRGATASRGEREAETLLEDLGYRILERQASLTWTIECDGLAVDVDLRADLLVERDGQRYVAEVKTGRQAPSIRVAATRRQLLEYSLAYRVDSVLLVDMESHEVQEVRFAR